MNEVADAWFGFLVAWKGIYTVLEQGSKSSPQSKQWFGRKKAERKAEPLLNYLFHARNDEEHGLSLHYEEGAMTWIVNTPDCPNCGSFEVSIKSSDPTPKVSTEVKWATAHDYKPNQDQMQYGPGLRLIPVKMRGGETTQAPCSFEKDFIDDISPLGVAKIGLHAIAGVIDEARQLRSA